MIANQRNPFMGLNNKICQNPVYWCRLHQVWLSDEDAKRKRCKEKPDFDMIGVHQCWNLKKGIFLDKNAGQDALNSVDL